MKDWRLFEKNIKKISLLLKPKYFTCNFFFKVYNNYTMVYNYIILFNTEINEIDDKVDDTL